MSRKESNLPVVGGVIAAIGAGICCVGPFVLLLLGVSGSWIASLTLLEPYRPIFILLVIALFGFAGWKIYRPITECEPDTACASPAVQKRRKMIFWLTGITALVLVTSNYWIIWLAS